MLTVNQYTSNAKDSKKVDVTFPVVDAGEFLERKKDIPTRYYRVGTASGAPMDGVIERRGTEGILLSKIEGRYYRVLRKHGAHGAMVPVVATVVLEGDVLTVVSKTALGNPVTRHYLAEWLGALEQDPIPAWALQAALSHLVESDAIDANGKGQTWLAEQLGRTPRSVRMWIDGSRNCSGLTAKAVREVIEEAMI